MLARLLQATLIVLLAVGGLFLHASTSDSSGRSTASALNVAIYIYKNGELLLVDNDDPATVNIAYLIAEYLDRDNNALEAPTGNRMDGAQAWSPSNKNIPIIRQTEGYGNVLGTRGAIVIGEDSLFSRTDYTLSTVHAIVQIDEFNITVDQDSIKIIVGGSYTLPSTAPAKINVTAVGLAVTTADPASQPDAGNTWLLFKDVLSQPVTLNPGDTIHVRYVISLP